MYPLHLINLNILQAMGRSDLFLRLEIIKKALVVINIAVAWRWGISAMICGMVVMSMVAYYLNSYYTGTLVGYPIREQLRDLSAYLIISMFMGIVVYAVGLLTFPNHWSMLMIQIGVGGGTYVILCRVFRLAAFMDIWQTGLSQLAYLRAGAAE
jgi:Zn-dependent protease with chaperone function